MCNQHFNPIQCIIPPYMMERLKESGKKKISQIGVQSLTRSVQLRARRDFVGSLTHDQALMLHPAKTQKKSAKLNMQVFDMKHGTDVNAAKLVWDNGKSGKTIDTQVKNCIKAGTATWDLYNAIFGRNSIDDRGLLVRHYVHYNSNYDNAMWDGSEMVYGDGDGKIFGDFTSDVDVVGHELTHGVTQYESDLAYHGQSGALNEAISDIFGVMVKQRLLSQDVMQADWLIGSNVLLGKQYAIRSLKAPGTAYVNHPQLGTDPQPATMAQFKKMPDTQAGDWGGVHINSGIPNFAFYNAAMNIGGFSWEKTGMIWYAAMTDDKFPSTASFADFKQFTIAHASSMFGSGSMEEKGVKAAWETAKV